MNPTKIANFRFAPKVFFERQGGKEILFAVENNGGNN